MKFKIDQKLISDLKGVGNRYWTDDELEFLRVLKFDYGLSTRAIYEYMSSTGQLNGRSKEAIYNKISKLLNENRETKTT